MSFSTVLTALIGALGLANLVLLVGRAKPTSEAVTTPDNAPHSDTALTAAPELTSVPQRTDGQPPG